MNTRLATLADKRKNDALLELELANYDIYVAYTASQAGPERLAELQRDADARKMAATLELELAEADVYRASIASPDAVEVEQLNEYVVTFNKRTAGGRISKVLSEQLVDATSSESAAAAIVTEHAGAAIVSVEFKLARGPVAADAQAVAEALAAAAHEHGAPNGFAPSELDSYGCRLGRMAIGRLAKTRLASINLELEGRGLVASYDDALFHVTPLVVDEPAQAAAPATCSACGGAGYRELSSEAYNAAGGVAEDCGPCGGSGEAPVAEPLDLGKMRDERTAAILEGEVELRGNAEHGADNLGTIHLGGVEVGTYERIVGGYSADGSGSYSHLNRYNNASREAAAAELVDAVRAELRGRLEFGSRWVPGGGVRPNAQAQAEPTLTEAQAVELLGPFDPSRRYALGVSRRELQRNRRARVMRLEATDADALANVAAATDAIIGLDYSGTGPGVLQQLADLEFLVCVSFDRCSPAFGRTEGPGTVTRLEVVLDGKPSTSGPSAFVCGRLEALALERDLDLVAGDFLAQAAAELSVEGPLALRYGPAPVLAANWLELARRAVALAIEAGRGAEVFRPVSYVFEPRELGGLALAQALEDWKNEPLVVTYPSERAPLPFLDDAELDARFMAIGLDLGRELGYDVVRSLGAREVRSTEHLLASARFDLGAAIYFDGKVIASS